MSKVRAIVCFGLYSILLSLPAGAATCNSLLASLKLPNTTINASQIVAAGTFVPLGSDPSPAALAAYKAMPAFCRVQGVIQPANDSHIEFEVWLPASAWNGRYMGIGNGGFGGNITYEQPPVLNTPGLAQALIAGYAASSTDLGHKAKSNDAQWALGYPEKIADFGYRAIHQTAEKSKAIIRAFYEDGPKHSYFSGCSDGGREALMEVQRFAADYDGIVAGAPTVSATHAVAGFIINIQATQTDPASYIPATKLPAVESAVLAACDALDGLKDGLIDDPRKCRFDPGTLLCHGPESDDCLTQPQVVALRKIYAGARTSNGEQIYPGYLAGGETGTRGWAAWVTGASPGKGGHYNLATQASAYMIFQDPAWDFRVFNLDRDIKVADANMGQMLNATDPDLKAFKDRGGKLLLFQGWSDAALAPTNTVNYYENVVAKMGRKDAESFTRLYMVPGMQHCGAGPGPNSFREPMTAALERWVEQGAAPDRIIATKYRTDGVPSSGVARTRPLCPYSQVARCRGSGSIDDAASFVCRAP